MVAKTVQGILLILDNVTLGRVLSMVIGQHGHNGVTVAKHVLVGQEFATELAATRHLNMVANTVQEILLI